MNANETFRNLVTLHIRITLLSDVFATAGYAHGRAAINLLQTLMSNMSSQVVSDLGSLHRATIWENITLKVDLAERGIDVVQTPVSSPLAGSPDRSAIALPEPDVASASGSNAPNGAGDAQPDASEPAPSKEIPKRQGPRDHNAAALKHWTHNLPGSLAPFFTGTAFLYIFYWLIR